jgi:hypothetical protein
MSSLLAEPPVVLPPGCEQPRICTAPASGSSSGDELADFAARFGVHLYPWQRNVLRVAMGEKPDGKWAAGEVGLVVPRQNGKGEVLLARELGGLFLLGERLITHTAHEFKTASDAYRRIRTVVESSPELMRRVKRMPNSPVEKAIELHNGNKLSFIARSGGSGRGFSGDVVILDEAYDLSQEHMDALGPTMTMAPDMQLWYTSSAGKKHSLVLAKLRKRGIVGERRLAYMEWSVDEPGLTDPPVDITSPELLAQANPSLAQISPDYLATERGMLSEVGLLRERFGIFDTVTEAGVFPENAWERLLDRESTILGAPTFALEVAEDRSWACIAAAGAGPAGLHVEVVEYQRGTGWIVDRMADLASKHGSRLVVQPTSAAGSLISELEARRVTVLKASPADYAAACGQFYDSVTDSRDVRHIGQQPLDISVGSALTRRSSDSWVWDRRNPNTDISPLAAVTLAAWGSRQKPKAGRFMAF